jgi:hypothetical protein
MRTDDPQLGNAFLYIEPRAYNAETTAGRTSWHELRLRADSVPLPTQADPPSIRSRRQGMKPSRA